MTRASLKSTAKLDDRIWRKLKQLKQLHYLSLNFKLMTLKGIEGLEQLRELELTCDAFDLTPIARLPHLNHLVLDKCFNLLDLEPIAFMSLEYLEIRSCHGLATLKDIRLMATLKTLIVHGNNRLLDTAFLRYLINLKRLDLQDSNKLVLVDGMGDYKCLEYLNVSGSFIRGVKSLPKGLKILEMERGLHIRKIEAMNCMSLHRVDLFDMKLEFVSLRLCLNLIDITGIKNLKLLDLAHCPVQNI
ncbi:hypothetical protein HDV01_002996 [Terramyces sp. JEL0728]|nr:hypothetical protein HDV01_002996 [Terramyces sp. JEL0728]